MVKGLRSDKNGIPVMKSSGKPKTIAYTPLSEKQKHEEMKKVIRNLHETGYSTSGFGGSSSKIGPVDLKDKN